MKVRLAQTEKPDQANLKSSERIPSHISWVAEALSKKWIFTSCLLSLSLSPSTQSTQKLVNFGARSNFRRCQHHPLSSFTLLLLFLEFFQGSPHPQKCRPVLCLGTRGRPFWKDTFSGLEGAKGQNWSPGLISDDILCGFGWTLILYFEKNWGCW